MRICRCLTIAWPGEGDRLPFMSSGTPGEKYNTDCFLRFLTPCFQQKDAYVTVIRSGFLEFWNLIFSCSRPRILVKNYYLFSRSSLHRWWKYLMRNLKVPCGLCALCCPCSIWTEDFTGGEQKLGVVSSEQRRVPSTPLIAGACVRSEIEQLGSSSKRTEIRTCKGDQSTSPTVPDCLGLFLAFLVLFYTPPCSSHPGEGRLRAPLALREAGGRCPWCWPGAVRGAEQALSVGCPPATLCAGSPKRTNCPSSDCCRRCPGRALGERKAVVLGICFVVNPSHLFFYPCQIHVC